jgi:hypothetical protein
MRPAWGTGTAHTLYSRIHLHLVWTTKYRKPVMSGEVGLRIREVIRQVCRAEAVDILKRHVIEGPCPSVRFDPAAGDDQPFGAAGGGEEFAHAVERVLALAEGVLGQASVGAGLFLLQQRERDGRGDWAVHREPAARGGRGVSGGGRGQPEGQDEALGLSPLERGCWSRHQPKEETHFQWSSEAPAFRRGSVHSRWC